MNEFAVVKWLTDDAIAAAAEYGVTLTEEQAAEWWNNNGKWFAEALMQTGNEILSDINWGEVVENYGK